MDQLTGRRGEPLGAVASAAVRAGLGGATGVLLLWPPLLGLLTWMQARSGCQELECVVWAPVGPLLGLFVGWAVLALLRIPRPLLVAVLILVTYVPLLAATAAPHGHTMLLYSPLLGATAACWTAVVAAVLGRPRRAGAAGGAPDGHG